MTSPRILKVPLSKTMSFLWYWIAESFRASLWLSISFRELDSHFLVKVRHAKTVYAADSRNDDYITAFHEGIGCGKAKFIDFLVY